MKTYKYKLIAFLILITVVTQAQTFDKKIKENFKVNPDVEIIINATNMDVAIETWNRNEVSVEVVMEVEGVAEKEAEKILKNWKFEALGNKSKVKITSLSNNTFYEFNHDFDFDHDFDFKFDFFEIDVDIPHFEMPEMPEMPEIPELPEMPEMPEMQEFEFDYQAYKNDSTYLKNYKMRVAEGVEKFKNSNWKKNLDSIRNSSGYKKKMKEFKEATKKMAKDLKESKWFKEIQELQNSEEFKQQMEQARIATEKATKEIFVNKDKILEQVKLVKEANKAALEEIKRMKEEGKLDSLHNYSENVYFFNSTNKNSKVKIKKYLKIKVPKKATFNLNVRHGKVTIPESNKKISANMSYGDFVGGTITGDKNELIFTNSPVIINSLISSNITLKNVPSAKFGTFENVNLFSNSSNVVIDEIGSDVALSQKFGTIKVKKIIPNFNKLNLILDYAKANLDFSNASYVFQINGKKSTVNLNKELTKISNKNVDGVQIIEGYYKNNSSINKLFLTGVFSTINLN
jgi:hypothetical protein